MIILDMGSGNSCRNDKKIVDDMIAAVAFNDSKNKVVVLKWQLFGVSDVNIPLLWSVFEHAYYYAEQLGYLTTASVFDLGSLEFLMRFQVPFVKIACRPELYGIADNCGVPVLTSYSRIPDGAENYLCCVSKYPAQIDDYLMRFSIAQLEQGISDHTVGFDLYKMYKPERYEKHFVLERSDDNPDAGPFACTPEDLGEIL